MQPYKINEAFTVFPQNNLINELKLEPRLMKLLCLLAEVPGKLVTREEIVEKIWNGYGGGDEGLTQAVSFLRKILNDTNRTIIETVPKSGYIFHGEVRELDGSDEHPAAAGPVQKASFSILIIITVVILAAVTFIFFKPSSSKTYAPKAVTPTPGAVTPAPSNSVVPQAKQPITPHPSNQIAPKAK